MAEEPKDPELIEAQQAADDLTLANATLKRDLADARRELADALFQLTETKRANAELLGEHGVENAKQVIAMMRLYEQENKDLRGVIERILSAIPFKYREEHEE